jgi:hypothetical protein
MASRRPSRRYRRHLRIPQPRKLRKLPPAERGRAPGLGRHPANYPVSRVLEEPGRDWRHEIEESGGGRGEAVFEEKSALENFGCEYPPGNSGYEF